MERVGQHQNGIAAGSDMVSLSAFPKSGVTYLSFMLYRCFFPDDCDIHELERKYIPDIHAFPNAEHVHPELPRLFKSHFPFRPDLPSVRLTGKAIYLIRHPVDVMMSAWDFQHLIKGSDRSIKTPDFRAFVRDWLDTGGGAFPEYGTWVDHVRSWLEQTDVPVHLVTYRDLVDQPARELDAILQFLGEDVQVERRRNAIERSSMKAMAAFEANEIENKIEGPFFNPAIATGLERGHRFVNKGYRNSYDRLLSPKDRALADRTFGREIGLYLQGSQ